MALAIVLVLGLVAPFVPARAAQVALMDGSGQIVAQGDVTELEALELLQEQNRDVRLLKYTAERALGEMRELVRPPQYPTLCMDVPPACEWAMVLAGAERSVSGPCRMLRGCRLAIRHYS